MNVEEGSSNPLAIVSLFSVQVKSFIVLPVIYSMSTCVLDHKDPFISPKMCYQYQWKQDFLYLHIGIKFSYFTTFFIFLFLDDLPPLLKKLLPFVSFNVYKHYQLQDILSLCCGYLFSFKVFVIFIANIYNFSVFFLSSFLIKTNFHISPSARMD